MTPFYVMEFLEKAREMEAEGEHIVHMEIGEPDFPTPVPVKDAAFEALSHDLTYYTHSLGIPELRNRIADHYKQTEGVSISPKRVVITNGTSGAFLLLFSVLLEKGSTLALSDPGYPCYKNIAALFDAEVRSINVSAETRFEVTEQELCQGTTGPELFIISNPANPTGMVYREETVASIEQSLAKRGSTFVVDEIYRGIVYEKTAHSAIAISDRIIVVDGFSKVFAMTGWRLGWMVVPEELIRPIQTVAQNVFIAPATLSQYAALKAFDSIREIEDMRKTYEERRNFLLPELIRLGFRIPIVPEGAFYIYASIEKWGIDSRDFVDRALREAKVALTPGYDFGTFQAPSYVRFSYATSIDKIKLGCDRLARWLKTL
ncbi:MAG TPA: pyridoxal phosphate-dependent aminotransferase [Nitrospirota bacterium]|nr:pyridoxal phosphate-dependent aminotransferase [Nitrospirota bacterium]